MKKTVSVNIKGINFLIEEDAYEKLENYLLRLKHSLNNQEGADEIIEDIEIRIAELCTKNLDDKREVVELADIEKILETLGDPSQFVDEEDESSFTDKKFSSQTHEDTSNSKNEKRLFRDTDNAQIAGVCQGIANYFNIDVVIIRIIWALIFFFGGFGLLLYIILWIVIPKANTSIDRLRMKGKPITVETVREEVEQAADKFSKNTKKFAANLKTDKSYSDHINTIGRFVSVAFALFSVLIGIGFLISFLVFILGGFQFIPAKTDTGFLSLTQLGELVLSSKEDVGSAWIGGLMLSISVITFFFLFGFYILFRLKNKWTKYSLAGLIVTGVIGAIICISVGIRTGRDMAIVGEIERSIGQTTSEQLTIVPQFQQLNTDPKVKIKSSNGSWMAELKGDKIYESRIRFNYRESADSLFHIYEIAESHAHTLESALKRAKNIQHDIVIIGDSLLVGTDFNYPKTDKFRAQNLRVLVEIPKGKSVLINGKIIRLGHEYDEENNNYKKPKENGRLHGDGRYVHED